MGSTMCRDHARKLDSKKKEKKTNFNLTQNISQTPMAASLIKEQVERMGRHASFYAMRRVIEHAAYYWNIFSASVVAQVVADFALKQRKNRTFTH